MRGRIKKNHIAIVLACIVWYCIYLLLYKLWVQSLWIDEWYSSYVSKYMALEWLHKSNYFLFEWLQVLFFKIWWFSDFWARFPSIIVHIGSILLMYFIPYKLYKNKYVWLFSALILGLLHWEIGRWRDARFYSLLQFLFLWWISTIIQWIETKRTIYLNCTIILTCLWVVFHPFLYVLWAILFFAIIQQYKKARDFKSIFSKKFLSTWILIWILLIVAIFFGSIWDMLSWSLFWDKPDSYIKLYFKQYNRHLRDQLWIVYIIWLLWMIWSIVKVIRKKEWKPLFLFFCPFILFAYALVIKWHLLHYRYALLLFPIIILNATVFVFDMAKLIQNKYINIIVVCGMIVCIGFSAKMQYLPTAYYFFDYTSPQPDFKSAYESIPDWQNVISGFPTLCDWYYSDRWNCVNAIRVDLVHDWKTEKLLKKTAESYTKIPYIDDIDSLWQWTYFFVIDNLTSKSSNINKILYWQIRQYWINVFDNWKNYNNIKVFRLDIK